MKFIHASLAKSNPEIGVLKDGYNFSNMTKRYFQRVAEMQSLVEA